MIVKKSSRKKRNLSEVAIKDAPMSHTFAAIDIGTNSIRLAVVRTEGQSMTTLDIQRQVVRLGEGEFEENRLTEDAIKRGVLVCARFAEAARGYGAEEIVAYATSAVREADNREEFIERVREAAGIEVKVISGVEEARLIWLGVSSGVDFGEKKAVLIDIGGGSTEVIVGDDSGYQYLESMRLGGDSTHKPVFPGRLPGFSRRVHDGATLCAGSRESSHSQGSGRGLSGRDGKRRNDHGSR